MTAIPILSSRLRLATVRSAVIVGLLGSCRPQQPEPAPPIDTADGNASGAKARQRPPGTDDSDAMRIHFIDIGQGDGVLLEFPCGAALIDTGGEKNDAFDSENALIAYLDDFFATRRHLNRTIDLLVVSHPHIDHTRNIAAVLERYTVRNVVDNGVRIDIDEGKQDAMHDWIANQGDKVGHLDVKEADIDPTKGLHGPVIDPIGGCDASATDPRIVALWGEVTDRLASYSDNQNNHSVVVRVDYGKSSALFTGDLEIVGISRLAEKYGKRTEIFDVDIYKVGHHGSKNATTHYLMQYMSPEIAVISCGPYDRLRPWTGRVFGHPNVKSLRHLVHFDYGVSGRRDPIEVWVGLKGAWVEEGQPFESRKMEVFERRTISKAVYATGWDGTVVVTANANGWIEVETEGKTIAAPPAGDEAP